MAVANEKKSEARKTTTNWMAFRDAGLKIKSLTCDGYFPYHRSNQGCHTPIVPSAKNALTHFKAEHGGGFFMEVVPTEKEWAGWQEFEDLGLELLNFTCGVCQQELRPSKQNILSHMRVHLNGNRRMTPGGEFRITISDSANLMEDDE
jgi:hypothetical protein